MEHVYTTLESKDFSESNDVHVLKGYASVFDNVDLDNDMIVKGAFTQSLKTREPQMLWGHDQSSVPIGKIATIHEDHKGLYFEAHLPMDDDLVKGRIAPQLRIGALKGISIGFRVKEREARKDGTRAIKQAELFEISLVNIPANPEASVTGFKKVNESCGALDFADLPLAGRNYSGWDEAAALKRVREFTGSEETPSHDYKDAFLYCEPGESDDLSSYKFLIADVIGDRLTAIPSVIYKTATTIMRSKETDISSAACVAIQKNLDRYYSKLNLQSASKAFAKCEWDALEAGEREARLRALGLSGGLAKSLSGQRDVGRHSRDASSTENGSNSVLLKAINELTQELQAKNG